MADFKKAKMKTLRWEGGFVNDSDDRGGLTFAGVAENFWGEKYPELFIRLKEIIAETNGVKKEIDKVAFSDEKFLSEIEKFYKDNFWDIIKGDEITDQSKAEALFDYSVNSGVSRAVKHAQEVCGITVDGKFGNQSLKAINEKDDFTNKLCDRRVAFLKKVAENGNNSKFLKGWLKRVYDFFV